MVPKEYSKGNGEMKNNWKTEKKENKWRLITVRKSNKQEKNKREQRNHSTENEPRRKKYARTH